MGATGTAEVDSGVGELEAVGVGIGTTGDGVCAAGNGVPRDGTGMKNDARAKLGVGSRLGTTTEGGRLAGGVWHLAKP